MCLSFSLLLTMLTLVQRRAQVDKNALTRLDGSGFCKVLGFSATCHFSVATFGLTESFWPQLSPNLGALLAGAWSAWNEKQLIPRVLTYRQQARCSIPSESIVYNAL